MSTDQALLRNPITSELHSRKRAKLRESFPELENCNHESYLSLSRYLDGIPERFYSEEAFQLYFSFLKEELANNPAMLKNNLNQETYRFDKALLSLNEINHEGWHDSFEKSDDYGFMHFCDKILHPSYLKLIEGVFSPFVYLLAKYSRIRRGKPIEGLDVFNCVEELKTCKYSDLCKGYDDIVRNGIAHGGTTYRDKAIVYQDKYGNERTLLHSGIVNLVDDFVDIYNGCTLAIKLFFVLNMNSGINIPRQFMIEEFQATTDSPWWHIEGCLTSELAGQSQLVIYARPKSRDYYKIQYLTFLSGALSERFAPGFNRYFFSLRSPIGWHGWAAFDGVKLRRIREKGNAKFEDYKGVLQDNLVFYKPDFRLPRFLGKIDTLWQSFRIHIRFVFEEIRNQLNHALIVVRNATIHRNGWRAVLNGSAIVYLSAESNTQEFVRQSCRKIIRKALKKARSQAKISNTARFLPLGYARIALFAKDFRIRKLENYGLGAKLIGTIQIKRIKRIKVPDIMGSTIEMKNSYRIVWNKAWLESVAE